MQLGIIDPLGFAKVLPATIFNQWRDYAEIEPFGAVRDNWNIAQLTALTANINRGKNSPTYNIEDFIYKDAYTLEVKQEENKEKETLSFFNILKQMAVKKNG